MNRARSTALAVVTTLAVSGMVDAAPLFFDDFNDTPDGSDPAGWVFNQPNNFEPQPADRTTVQGGVVHIAHQASDAKFAQLTPGSNGVYTVFATGDNNKIILSGSIAGNTPDGTHANGNAGMYLYAAAGAQGGEAPVINDGSNFYTFDFNASGNGTIRIRERDNEQTANVFPAITATTLINDGKFDALDLNAMNDWRFELTKAENGVHLALYLNNVLVISGLDESPRTLDYVTPAVYTNGANDIAFDNVMLDAVPEPGAVGLLSTAGLLLLRRRGN